ncbi:MAG: NAD(P)H-binding protein [Bacteroidota bacterium]
MKTAIVIGATGLIGGILVKKLLQDARYGKVKIFTRRKTGISDPKLQEHLVDFNLIEMWQDKITGDELFSALGTTIKQAGSKEKQYLVDYTYQYEIAKAAAINQVLKFLLVSSVGANKFSPNFYLRMKGALDYAVSEMPFNRIVIFQPAGLIGEREIPRFGEKIGIVTANFVTGLFPLLKNYKPIRAERVADAMINAANDSTHQRLIIYKSEQINQIAE